MEYETIRKTREISVSEAREKLVAQVNHGDEQTLAKMFAVAYDHILSCRYDITRDLILYDMYEHRLLTIEESENKEKKEEDYNRVAEEVLEKTKQLVQEVKDNELPLP
jgi:hypothetical protein